VDNKQIIEKAAMTLASLATGGKMNDTQFNTFYRKMIDSPTILRDARTVVMPIDSMKIEKIGFGSRVLRPGVEGTALQDNQLAVPTTSTIRLDAKEVIAEVNITYDTLENNIEGDRLYDTIMQLLAERVALDMEELIINGDTSNDADPYLKLIDGIRKKATSHIVDMNGDGVTKALFKRMYAAVPTKYLRNPADWRFYTSYSNELEWKDQVVSRQTALGDQTLQGGMPNAFGIPVKGIAMLQGYDIDGAGAETDIVNDAFLVHPKNIAVGFSRNVTVEVDKDIRARKFIIVLTAKLDVQFEEEDAVAKAIKIKNTIS